MTQLREYEYAIIGRDNRVHYKRELGHDAIINDARFAPGYYIVHHGPICRRRQVIVRIPNGTEEGIAFCVFFPVYTKIENELDMRTMINKAIKEQLQYHFYADPFGLTQWI